MSFLIFCHDPGWLRGDTANFLFFPELVFAHNFFRGAQKFLGTRFTQIQSSLHNQNNNMSSTEYPINIAHTTRDSYADYLASCGFDGALALTDVIELLQHFNAYLHVVPQHTQIPSLNATPSDMHYAFQFGTVAFSITQAISHLNYAQKLLCNIGDYNPGPSSCPSLSLMKPYPPDLQIKIKNPHMTVDEMIAWNKKENTKKLQQ